MSYFINTTPNKKKSLSESFKNHQNCIKRAFLIVFLSNVQNYPCLKVAFSYCWQVLPREGGDIALEITW